MRFELGRFGGGNGRRGYWNRRGRSRAREQQFNAVKTVLVRSEVVRTDHTGAGSGDGTAEVEPGGLLEIGLVLHLVIAAGNGVPTECDRASCFRDRLNRQRGRHDQAPTDGIQQCSDRW